MIGGKYFARLAYRRQAGLYSENRWQDPPIELTERILLAKAMKVEEVPTPRRPSSLLSDDPITARVYVAHSGLLVGDVLLIAISIDINAPYRMHG
jgi:hypothetical protein